MKAETVCGLDIGTTKTCAVVAVDGPAGLEIVGVGEAPSLGMRKGVVVDLEETIKSIEGATEKAERMAGVHISDVFVGITGDHIRSTNNRAVVAHKIGALPELITHGGNGLLVEPFQPQLLAETLRHAFDSPRECEAMAAGGSRSLDESFTKARWLDQMAGIYRKIGFS